MSDTTSVTVANHVMSEIMAAQALKPMRRKFPTLSLINTSSIDGVATLNRKIPKRTEIAAAVADTEDVAITAYEQFAYATSITLTPAAYVQGIRPTIKSLRRMMPGAPRDAVIAAIQRGSPQALPTLAAMAEELIQAHYRTAELTACALFNGLSEHCGTTNTALTTSALVDGQTAVLDNNPEHHTLACVIGQKAIGDIKKEILTGSNGNLWASGYGNAFLEALGGAAPAITPDSNLLGMPVFTESADMLAFANGTTDKQGAIFCVGRGETATPGSMRGFAEFCEGHNLSMTLQLDDQLDVARLIGRYEWDVQEHTDEHGAYVLYKAT